MVKTLIHEAAHAILHAGRRACSSPPRKEVEAESVAFVVASRPWDGDRRSYSFPYVAGWAGDDPVCGRPRPPSDR